MNILLPVLVPFSHADAQHFIDIRLQVFQTEIFQFVLDPADPDAIGQGGVNLQCFLRDFLPLSLIEVLQRPHVMQPISELDDHDADIVRHREHHLSEIFRLFFLRASEGNFSDLGDAVDQVDHFFSKLPFKFLGRRHRIFQGIVEQSGHDRRHVGFQHRQHPGHRHRMLYIGFSGTPRLAFVRLGGKLIGLADHTEIRVRLIVPDPRQELLDIGNGFVHHTSYSNAAGRMSRMRN